MRILVVMVALMCSGCGSCDVKGNPLEKEFANLRTEQTTDAPSAETAYGKIEKFVGKLEKTKELIPDGLLAKAKSLQRLRAREYAKTAALDGDFASAWKVIKALKASHIDPTVEGALDTREGSEIDLRVKQYLKSVDPTSDNIKDYK